MINLTKGSMLKIEDYETSLIPGLKLDILVHIRPHETMVKDNGFLQIKINLLFYDIKTKELLYTTFFLTEDFNELLGDKVISELEDGLIYDVYNSIELNKYEKTN